MYFYKNFEIEVFDSVYSPKEDSELLVKAIEEEKSAAKGNGKIALDMGCGSGLGSLILAEKVLM